MKPPPTPPPPKTCIVCGTVQDDRGWDAEPYMTDITVVTAQGEEGHAVETRFVCLDSGTCLEELTTKLVDLGFGNHRHGGINFLEDMNCIGAERYGSWATPDDVEDE